MAFTGYVFLDNLVSAVKANRPFDISLSIIEKIKGNKFPDFIKRLDRLQKRKELYEKRPESYFEVLTPEIVEIGDMYFSADHRLNGVSPMRVIMKHDNGFTARYSWWSTSGHNYGTSNGVILKKDKKGNIKMYAEQHFIDSLNDIDTKEPPAKRTRFGLEAEV